MPARRHWLFKSEPSTFSIHDLAAAKDKTTCWDGVRNYQARNLLRDEIQVGDLVLFYHSSCDPTAVVGTAKVVRSGYPDHTAWDKKSDHYDPKASAENPIWSMVDIRLVDVFDTPVTLTELRAAPALKDMMLLKRGSRLSVQPVTAAEFDAVVRLAGKARK
jgi:predicted RNA-binding protein with PUA-like domain